MESILSAASFIRLGRTCAQVFIVTLILYLPIHCRPEAVLYGVPDTNTSNKDLAAFWKCGDTISSGFALALKLFTPFR
jgi:hypothetical protein